MQTTTFRRFIVFMLIIVGIRLMDPHCQAAAQTPVPPAAVQQGWRNHFEIGGSAGLGATTDHSLEKWSTDLNGVVDVPLTAVWSLRGDVERNEFGVPGFVGSAGHHEAVRLTRVSVGATRFTNESIHCRFRPYVLASVGVYRYALLGGGVPEVTRVGGSGGVGFENIFSDGHAAFTGEVKMHAVHGPEFNASSAYSMFVVTYTFGLKARF